MTIDSRIARAIAAITEDDVRRDLLRIARPRHHEAAPAHLAEVAALVEAEWRRLGYAVSRLPVPSPAGAGDVIIGERGGAPDAQVVIVDAHYDAVLGSPGADDNASGVAGLLGVGRALARLDTAGRVRLIAFPVEEEDLAGSRHYVGTLDAAARRRITAVFNFEMIGYRATAAGSQRYPAGLRELFPGRAFPARGDFIAAIGLADQPAPLAALDAARAYTPDLAVEVLGLPRIAAALPDLRRSDHAPFWDAGIPAVFVGDTANFRNPHYHRPSDTADTVDVAFATRVARWAAAAAALTAGVR